MKKLLIFIVLAFVVLITIESCSVPKENITSQQKLETIIQSENSQVQTPKEAPPECLNMTKEFITYILRDKPDIADDKKAQDNFLSESLLEGLAHRQKTYQEHKKKISVTDNPEEPPGNRDFVGSWDYPTTYQIEGSRLYNERAIVDIAFTWGKKTNYPGDKRLVSYIFKGEGNYWRLDDIYTFEGQFIPASSLKEEFNHPNFP